MTHTTAIDLTSVLSGYNTRLYVYAGWEELSETSYIGYGDLEESNEIDPESIQFIGHSSLSYSDYSSATLVEKSNIESFLESFGDLPGVYEFHGGYGTWGVVVEVNSFTEEMAEVFAALENYHLIDEDSHSQMEMEAESIAWDLWIKSDFISAIERKFDCELEISDEGDLEKLYDQARDWAGEYGCNESADSWNIDIDRIVAEIDLEDVIAYDGIEAIREEDDEISDTPVYDPSYSTQLEIPFN